MTFVPLHVQGKCVMDDQTLFGHMEAAIARGLPQIKEQAPAKEGFVALVASGPSVASQLDVIKKMQEAGTPIVAIKDAHDWLIRNGVVPDYALAIDPQEHRWNCFVEKRKGIRYMIASQCHKAVFDHLEGLDVTIWHPYITKGQNRPSNVMLIGGGTTSGLRAISLFYVLGFRHFALFGYDSCLSNGNLRVNGDKPKEGVVEVRVGNGKVFQCNPSMALQAQHFQTYFDYLPDAHYYAYGDGLIAEILKERERQIETLHALYSTDSQYNDRVSFIHFGDRSVASYRYRAEAPAKLLEAKINDFTAGTLVFTKPQPHELMQMAQAKASGQKVIVDFCDDHFEWMHYQEALRLADVVTCNTERMRERIKEFDKEAHVIPDPYEYPEVLPHCGGTCLLWYGHSSNLESLQRILPDLQKYPLRVVSNHPNAIPWSWETMVREFLIADIVIVPKTAEYKSNNRTLEAIRNGCFVVAEPHPSLKDIPGIWIGNIKEGIEWARKHPQEANARTRMAQNYVKERYSPQTQESAWRKVIKLASTLGLERSNGPDGSTLTCTEKQQTLDVTLSA